MPSHDDAPIAVQARKAGTAAEIDVYGDIGFWGITAASFKDALRGLGDVKSLVVNVNSPGGDVFDGITIYNDLVSHPADITVRVNGLAASAASLIAMAGDRVEIADNAFFMVHNAWSAVMGNRHEIAEVAKVLGKIDDSLASTYAKRSGLDISAVRDMMDAETWLDSGDAVDHGFADAVISSEEADDGDDANAFDLSRFRNTPSALRRKRLAPARAAIKPAAPAVPDPSAVAIMADLRALMAAMSA